MPRLLLFACLIFATGIVSLTMANPELHQANWQRDTARTAVTDTNTGPALTELLDMAGSVPAQQTIAKIEALIKHREWPLPAREKTLFDFTQKLRFRAPFSVPMTVLQYLQNYQSQVLVPHQDHPNSAVPLYPIRAAANGVRTHWIRSQARIDGQSLLNKDPAALVQNYLAAADKTVLAGFEDALLGADSIALMELTAVLAALPRYARQLAMFKGKTAILAGDTELLLRAFGDLPTASQGQLLQLSAEYLAPADSARVLSRIIANAPVSTAALAIANLAPGSLKIAAVEDVLLETLARPGLTTTTALALTRYGSTSALDKLHSLSHSSDNPAMARRIRLALESAESDLPKGDRR